MCKTHLLNQGVSYTISIAIMSKLNLKHENYMNISGSNGVGLVFTADGLHISYTCIIYPKEKKKENEKKKGNRLIAEKR